MPRCTSERCRAYRLVGKFHQETDKLHRAEEWYCVSFVSCTPIFVFKLFFYRENLCGYVHMVTIVRYVDSTYI